MFLLKQCNMLTVEIYVNCIHPRIITWGKLTFNTLRLRPQMGLTYCFMIVV